jgi:hypothetical protein
MSIAEHNARKARQQGVDAYPNGTCPYTTNARYRAAWFSGYNQEKFISEETDRLLRLQTEYLIEQLEKKVKESS